MLKSIISKIRSKITLLDEHSLEVVKKSSSSMIVKVMGMVAGLGVSVFLGRTIGAEGLGIIELANRTASILLVLSLFGTPNVIIKEVAIGNEKKDWQHVGNTMATAFRINGSFLLFIITIALLLVPWLSNSVFKSPDIKIPLYVTFIAVIAQVISRIYSSGVIGLRRIWQGNLVNETLSLWIIGIGLTLLYISNYPINLLNVIFIFGIGRLGVALSLGLYWKHIFQFKSKWTIQTKKLLKTAKPLLLVSAAGLITANIDSVMLGWLNTSKEVGLYNVAVRLSILTIFFLQISNSAIAPKVASLFSEGKIDAIRKMVQQITKLLFGLGLVSLLVFVTFGTTLLSIWGNEFKVAYPVLVILGIGQFINLSTGAVGTLLIMSGNEKIKGIISFIFMLLNILLNWLLIRHFGALGAAVATSITIALENITNMLIVYRKLGILTFSLKN